MRFATTSGRVNKEYLLLFTCLVWKFLCCSVCLCPVCPSGVSLLFLHFVVICCEIILTWMRKTTVKGAGCMSLPHWALIKTYLLWGLQTVSRCPDRSKLTRAIWKNSVKKRMLKTNRLNEKKRKTRKIIVSMKFILLHMFNIFWCQGVFRFHCRFDLKRFSCLSLEHYFFMLQCIFSLLLAGKRTQDAK